MVKVFIAVSKLKKILNKIYTLLTLVKYYFL